jgi:hypothetical protein
MKPTKGNAIRGYNSNSIIIDDAGFNVSGNVHMWGSTIINNPLLPLKETIIEAIKSCTDTSEINDVLSSLDEIRELLLKQGIKEL